MAFLPDTPPRILQNIVLNNYITTDSNGNIANPAHTLKKRRLNMVPPNGTVEAGNAADAATATATATAAAAGGHPRDCSRKLFNN